MKVSVIIPIYNTGEYLRACIGSICRQTHRDLQIIMIDDGSAEPTAAICDQIAASDHRITIVHKPNEGVSKARNLGLEIADGDVVCFVDSDDTIEPSMIEDLLAAMERDNSSIAMCDAVTITPGRPDEPDTIPDFDSSCVIDVKTLSPATLTQLAGSAWRCAYKRIDTLLAKQARFPEWIKFSEDRIFNIIAMSAADRISYIKHPYYNRLIREGSACFRYYPDMTAQIAAMRARLIAAVNDNWGAEYTHEYERQIAGHIRHAVSNFASMPTEAPLKKLRELCDNASVRQCLETSCDSDIRTRLILGRKAFSLLLFGSLVNFYHKIWKK